MAFGKIGFLTVVLALFAGGVALGDPPATRPSTAPHQERIEPVFHLPGSGEVYQRRYFDGDIRAELAVGDRFATERNHFNYSQLQWNTCCFGYGCFGGAYCGLHNYFIGLTRYGGYSGW